MKRFVLFNKEYTIDIGEFVSTILLLSFVLLIIFW